MFYTLFVYPHQTKDGQISGGLLDEMPANGAYKGQKFYMHKFKADNTADALATGAHIASQYPNAKFWEVQAKINQ